MAKILIVEDDPVIVKSLFFYIRSEEHEPIWAQTLLDARAQLARHEVDLVLLDLNLPDGRGSDFCRELRESGFARPVLMLTAMGSEDSVLEGLNSGANDYIKKPYSIRELLTRIRIHLYGVATRDAPASARTIEGLEIDFPRGQARYNGDVITLSQTKLAILDFFISNANQIISREALLQHLKKDADTYDRTIDAHISQLRRALRTHRIDHLKIVSIYGAGYKFETHQKISAHI